MTCNVSEDNSTMNNGSTPRNQKSNYDDKYLSTDIVKQVETWMKNQRLSEQYAPITQRSQMSPPLASERRNRRSRKRNQKDSESGLHDSESINYTESEIVSTADSKPQKRLFEPKDRRNGFNNGFKGPPKYSNGFNRDSSRSFERPNKFSRFGSIHDEIEFQKRYKRISDLQNHLQFVNESYLSGKNILSEQKKLAPVTHFKKYNNLDTSDMFAISPLEKQHIKTKSKSTNFLAATPLFKKSPKKKSPSWQKFQKLPNITPDSKPHKKALSESNVKFVEESEREVGKPGYASSALLSQTDSKDERCKSVVTDSSYGPYQEMKVTIHIKYKKPNTTPVNISDDDYDSDNSYVDTIEADPPYQYDGRVHAINQDNQSSKHSNISKNDIHVSENPKTRETTRTSNISSKSKDKYMGYEGGALSSLVITDPISKTPRLTAGRISE